jgi:hypothetical protein
MAEEAPVELARLLDGFFHDPEAMEVRRGFLQRVLPPFAGS